MIVQPSSMLISYLETRGVPVKHKLILAVACCCCLFGHVAIPQEPADSKVQESTLELDMGVYAEWENTLVGKVTRVTDGDSIKIESDGEEFEVQLEGIDAPEFKQDFGKESAKMLRELIAGEEVSIKWNEKDRYERILGHVFTEKRHINLVMIEHGGAWHYARYNKDETLAEAEIAARESKVGLWDASDEPEAPWDFRRKK